MFGLAAYRNAHKAISHLPRNRLAVLSSKWPHPHDTIRRPQGSILNLDVGPSTRVRWSRSRSIMSHPPSAPSAEPVIARGEDEDLLRERLKTLIKNPASPSTDGLWNMSTDRMGLERQISFRTFKLCWVRRMRSHHIVWIWMWWEAAGATQLAVPENTKADLSLQRIRSS